MGYTLSNDNKTLVTVTPDTVGVFTVPTGVIIIDQGAFEGCSLITEVILPSTVSWIKTGAFIGCIAMTSITIPNSVNIISPNAFYGCSSLTSVTIPSSITVIEPSVFQGCSSLNSVIIPDGVTHIGAAAFAECSSLTSVIIPSSVTQIDQYAFSSCLSLTSINIPDGVTQISIATFLGCISLPTITIPTSVTLIETKAFMGCTSLVSITIPSSVDTMMSLVFESCRSLIEVNLSSNLTLIDAYTFSNCTALTSITIPFSVAQIGEYAFANCTNLRTINIARASNQITLAANVFSGSPLVQVQYASSDSSSYDPFCFFGQTPILTPAGYKPIASLQKGDYVQTADGRHVQIQRVHIQRVAPTAANQPIRIPRGYAGATQTIYVSPKHRIRGPAGFAEASKQPGLRVRPFENTLTYYNLELPCWDTDNLVAAGVVAESMAPVRRMEMTLAEFATLIRREYGAAAASPAVIAKIMKTCKFLPDGRVAAPVMKRTQ